MLNVGTVAVHSACGCVFVCQMSAQMLQLQSREEQERMKMQQFADTVDSSSAEQPSSSQQLLDVIRLD